MDKEGFGRRLAASVALRGETYASIEKAVGVSRSTLWRYTSGREGEVSLQKVAAVAQHLEVSLDYLVYGNGSIQ